MKEAEKICSLLSKQGHETYIVGGFVRDMLLGISGYDVDIAILKLWYWHYDIEIMINVDFDDCSYDICKLW